LLSDLSAVFVSGTVLGVFFFLAAWGALVGSIYRGSLLVTLASILWICQQSQRHSLSECSSTKKEARKFDALLKIRSFSWAAGLSLMLKWWQRYLGRSLSRCSLRYFVPLVILSRFNSLSLAVLNVHALCRYHEAELLHARWAMLAAVGCLVPEVWAVEL
jgi:hypothetical protein